MLGTKQMHTKFSSQKPNKRDLDIDVGRKDNIIMCFKEQDVDWTDMAHKRIQWQALVHTGMNILVT
jgi:hypothetical protein